MADTSRQIDPQILAQLLMGMRGGASNSGPVSSGMPQANAMFGQQNAPAFGGSMQLPGTGLSIGGQYQRYPGDKPNMGLGLRYGVDF